MKEIKLSQSGRKYKGMYVALVDDADYEWLNQFRWTAFISNCTVYAKRVVDFKTILLHRVILGLTNNHVGIDHINGDGLDNRRDNLRIATQSQNTRNRKKSKLYRGKSTSSVYKGVYWDKARHKWVASSLNVYLGRFVTEKDAARAYNEYAIGHFGEFARLNNVD
jgi:hypothetical protein